MNEVTFEPFPKLSRLSRDMVVTEKLDGTNAQVIITDDGKIGAGSRTRLITPGKTTDNYGFAAWVEANKEELLQLGPGRHFGEWYGSSIQRTYGLTERRFALFNTGRWGVSNPPPKCCEVVPVLYAGLFDQTKINEVMTHLHIFGSQAVPGFMNPEGVVVYHTASKMLFKKTFEHDDKGKDWGAN